MKTIGLLGGMSWESTSQYYRLLNEQMRQRLGGLHSARVALYSVDFAPLEAQMRAGNWPACAELLRDGARRVAASGADFLLLCTNTLHKLAADIENAIDIPFIHIIDATAEHIVNQNIRRIGLLGTRFTMEESFYTERLQRYNLATMVPSRDDRAIVDQVIFRELCVGRIEKTSKDEYLRIINELVARGAEAIIAGCTEIPLLVHTEECPVPLFDTTALHAAKAVQLALEE